jgi:hypothetical protein
MQRARRRRETEGAMAKRSAPRGDGWQNWRFDAETVTLSGEPIGTEKPGGVEESLDGTIAELLGLVRDLREVIFDIGGRGRRPKRPCGRDGGPDRQA